MAQLVNTGTVKVLCLVVLQIQISQHVAVHQWFTFTHRNAPRLDSSQDIYLF